MANNLRGKNDLNPPTGKQFTYKELIFKTLTSANLTAMTNDRGMTVRCDHMFINIHTSLTIHPQTSAQHNVGWQEDKNFLLTHLK